MQLWPDGKDAKFAHKTSSPYGLSTAILVRSDPVIFTRLRRVAQCSACVNTCEHVFGCGCESAYDEPGLRSFWLSHLSPLTRRRVPSSTPFFLHVGHARGSRTASFD